MPRSLTVVVAVQLFCVTDLCAQAKPRGFLADSSLAFLAPLIGSWRPLNVPDSLLRANPPVVAHDYRWTVGRKAIRLREGFRFGQADDAQLDGLIYWNPSTERVEFVAVAGKGDAEGRLFVGAYRHLADGAIERIYDVFYRAAADVPGEELGGSRRQYKEVYRLPTPDSIAATLDWFSGGAWQPFGAFARHSFKRVQ